MTWWTAGAVLVSGYMGSQAAGSAADTQAAAADRAAQLQNEQYKQTRQDQMPFLQAGVGALNKLAPLASNYKPFDYNTMAQDPGYAFRLSEGQKALDRSAAARGGLISGGALKAATRFGQDMGSQEYTNAFNRYQAERSAQLNPLQSLAGLGQSAATTLGSTGATSAANVGNLITGGAAANAAGQVGQANAISSGLGTYLNYNQGNNLVNVLRNNNVNSNLINQYGAGNVYTPRGGGVTNPVWNGETTKTK
jgi:hypothetical protein